MRGVGSFFIPSDGSDTYLAVLYFCNLIKEKYYVGFYQQLRNKEKSKPANDF